MTNVNYGNNNNFIIVNDNCNVVLSTIPLTSSKILISSSVEDIEVYFLKSKDIDIYVYYSDKELKDSLNDISTTTKEFQSSQQTSTNFTDIKYFNMSYSDTKKILNFSSGSFYFVINSSNNIPNINLQVIASSIKEKTKKIYDLTSSEQTIDSINNFIIKDPITFNTGNYYDVLIYQKK